jgi:ubiquinone/menaquinone biosynthesis C-methylase UbiE
MAGVDTIAEDKEEVRRFWNAEPCGTRYLQPCVTSVHEECADWVAETFEAHAHARYALEPHIAEFAGFRSAAGKKVLEIGVGMGADYLEWLKVGAQATGIDISKVSIARARRRCELAGYNNVADLRVADAENLPFADNSFDLVYSYGVMHHSPDTVRCIQEARRVLRPGGEARIMLYHHPSVTGLLLWLRYGIWWRKSLRQSVYDHLESPGTKTYTQREALDLMQGFCDLKLELVFSPGDLLLHEPSSRFQSIIYGWLWKVYPRWLVRTSADEWKLFLLVSATKE